MLTFILFIVSLVCTFPEQTYSHTVKSSHPGDIVVVVVVLVQCGAGVLVVVVL